MAITIIGLHVRNARRSSGEMTSVSATAPNTGAPIRISPRSMGIHPTPAIIVTSSAAALTNPTTTSASPATVAQAGLPVAANPGDATQVITVTATSTGSTTATLQAWSRQDGHWIPYTAALSAEVGTDGLTTHPSETRSATPIGSFTLTQAFGADPNPGTSLPYQQTDPTDWWISQPGPLYNTRQRCARACPFQLGAPNEHLYDEIPSYNYAVVIDYNTPNVGVVTQGAGSAYFLHVSTGRPTAGCIAIAQNSLTTIMRWLDPRQHPHILIGLADSSQ